jgi:hypothetical protein
LPWHFLDPGSSNLVFVFGHPYRTADRRPIAAARERPSVEDQVVAAVLFVVGSLGVIVGIARPTRAVELSLGLVMLFFVARSVLSDRRRLG